MKTHAYLSNMNKSVGIPSIADMVSLHVSNGTVNDLPWFSDRDTLIENVKYGFFNKEEIELLTSRQPSTENPQANAMGVCLIEHICDMEGLPAPKWVEDIRTKVDFRSPVFGKLFDQTDVRTFLQANNGNKFVEHGVFHTSDDYRIV